MAGQAAYCAIKAGLDHASRAIALDEALKPRGAKVVSLAPGVIDTDMQAQLRAADASAFPEHALFVQLKSAGRLSAPQDTRAPGARLPCPSRFRQPGDRRRARG